MGDLVKLFDEHCIAHVPDGFELQVFRAAENVGQAKAAPTQSNTEGLFTLIGN